MNLYFFVNHPKTTIVLLIFSAIGIWFVGMMLYGILGSIEFCYTHRETMHDPEGGMLSICDLFYRLTG